MAKRKPLDLTGLAYKNLAERLRTQSKNVLMDGWTSAARIMRNAADTLDYLEEKGVIVCEKSEGE